MVRIVFILTWYIWGWMWLVLGIKGLFGKPVAWIAMGVLGFGFAAVYGYLTAPRRPQ